jgi:quercetin dioxygenase-like cupin family protein
MRVFNPVIAAVLFCSLAGLAPAQMSGHTAQHKVTAATDLTWGPAPPALPPGAMAVVLNGDPTKEGQHFVLRVKMPDGYKVPAHWHPVEETVTVLQGNLLIGLGNKFDEAALKSLGPGDFTAMPAKTNHFAAAKGETIFQVSAMGPFALTYVNPDDDPRNKKTSSR